MSFVNAYNFIPLKGKKEKKKYCEYNAGEKLFTGKIECRLITKTELIIPDHELGTPPSNKQDNTAGKYPFMTVNGRPMIPGSSLRGMFRNAFEAITDSCVFTNDNYYFSSRTGKPKEAGLLERVEGGWQLYDAVRYGEGCRHRKATYSEKNKGCFIPDKKGGKGKCCEYKDKCYSITRPAYKPLLTGYETGEMVYIQVTGTKIADVMRTNPGGYQEGYVLIVDDNRNMKSSGQSVFVKGTPIIDGKFTKGDVQIKAFEDNIKKYRKDDNTVLFADAYNDKFNALKVGEIIPVWYEYSDISKKYYFALSQMSRNVYTNKPKDIIEKEHTKLSHCENSDNLCPACALFGFISGKSEETNETEDFSAGSKVRFADAWCDSENILSENETKKLLPVLGSPRSSSLEFYLRHDNNFYHADYDGVTLSGRKFYWHHSNFDVDNLVEPNEKLHLTSCVQYAKRNAEFGFDVYFDGITETQLNQLYTAVTYGDNDISGKLCHKLGHGKPLGFGSVKVIADNIFVRSFVDGEYTEDENYKPDTIKIPEEVKIAADFNSISSDSSDKKIDYPRLENNGDIFKWFAKNRPISGNSVYYTKLPRITDLDQNMPSVPQRNDSQTQPLSYSDPALTPRNFETSQPSKPVKKTAHEITKINSINGSYNKFNPKMKAELQKFIVDYEADPELYKDFANAYEKAKTNLKK